MTTKAIRMYGTRDLRLEEFELPEIKEDEILVKVMSDSICMSTYKLAELGDQLLAFDGCLNFFAGPADSQFKAEKILFEHYGVL